MSQPTSTNPNKRSSPCSSTSNTAVATRDATTYAAGSSGATIFPAMKAKSQAVAYSLDSNKNSRQSITPHVHFADTPALSPMIEDDPSEVREAAALGGHEGGTIANLSRKKATPPKPAKKLVIKLSKVFSARV